jgi:hypothetical protein
VKAGLQRRQLGRLGRLQHLAFAQEAAEPFDGSHGRRRRHGTLDGPQSRRQLGAVGRKAAQVFIERQVRLASSQIEFAVASDTPPLR